MLGLEFTTQERTRAIQRLTALWALNECGLGGLMHALNSPFTGLTVGSIAMCCIASICFFAKNKWPAVLSSLLVVLIIKGLVSPHSTPTAYLAVSFQAVAGACIYRWVPGLLFSSMLFVTIGLLESAFQRILTLTILYGNTLWKAIDMWGMYVTEKWGVVLPISSSRMLIGTYVLIYFLTGLVVGWLLYRLLISIRKHWSDVRYKLVLTPENQKVFLFTKKSASKSKRVFFFLAIILIILLSYMWLNPSSVEEAWISIIRALLILIVWFAFLGPLMMKFVKKSLDKKHSALAEEVSHAMDAFPYLLWILDQTRKETKSLNGWPRAKNFVLYSLLYILQFRLADDPHIDRAGSVAEDHNET